MTFTSFKDFQLLLSVLSSIAKFRNRQENKKKGLGYCFSNADLSINYDEKLGNLLMKQVLLQKEIDEHVLNMEKEKVL